MINFRERNSYHEHSLENLDFYLWYQDYKRRWDELPLTTKLQSPPPQEKPSYVGYALSGTGKRHQSATELGDSGLMVHQGAAYPNETIEDTAAKLSTSSFGRDYKHDSSSMLTASTYATGYEMTTVPSPESYYQGTNPDTQPFRQEVELVLKTFFAQSSDKELNIEGYLRQYVLHNSKYTTNPEVFEPVRDKVYETIERSSLRNFVNYALQNVNHNGVILRWSLAALCAVCVVVLLIVTFVLHVSRWYRVIILPLMVLLIVCGISAKRGVCFQRAMSNRRQLHHYELIENDNMNHSFLQKSKVGDVESISKNLHIVQDPHVKRYNMTLVLTSSAAAVTFALCLTAVIVAIPQ
ncbi:hypothetical protein Unana1_00170 [Umbelopsis nana]